MEINGEELKFDKLVNERVELLLEQKVQSELNRRQIIEAKKTGSKLYKDTLEDASFYKRKILHGEIDSEDWLTTYADVITLILTLFVLLLSLSQVDQKEFEKVKQSINKELLKKNDNSTFENMEKNVKIIFDNSKFGNKVIVSMDAKGLRVELSSSTLYDLGSAEIKPEIIPALKDLVKAIKGIRVAFPNYLVEVEGHTDNIPINTFQFPSNWELSANRATNIVRFFINEGLPPQKFRAAGYSDSRPKLPNTDNFGNPIPQNQAANRRVVIFIQRDS